MGEGGLLFGISHLEGICIGGLIYGGILTGFSGMLVSSNGLFEKTNERHIF